MGSHIGHPPTKTARFGFWSKLKIIGDHRGMNNFVSEISEDLQNENKHPAFRKVLLKLPLLFAPKPSNLGGASTIPSTAKRHTSTGGRRHHSVKSRGDG